jgi:nucleoside-diphosphate-sugar epimerase
MSKLAYTAVVTGASGYVATETVKQLLEKGYNVRATVRSVSNKDKVAHLEKLAEALPGTLTLHEADLLKEGSFDEVVKGADYVFHMASPFFAGGDDIDPHKDLIDPAVNGTKNVLGSVSKEKSTIKRVVLTSSFASVVKAKAGPSKPPLFTEEDWNDEATPETTDGAYYLSKTLAEKAAWEIAEKEGFELVAINPTLVLGPILSSRADGVSRRTISGILEGGEISHDLLPWLCDVRDVARAHVLGAENPKAKGQRFIVSQGNTTAPKVITDALKARFPGFKIQDGGNIPSEAFADNSKALQELGLGKLYDPATSVVDMAVTLIQKGVATPRAV